MTFNCQFTCFVGGHITGMGLNRRLKLRLDGKAVVVKVNDLGHTCWTSGGCARGKNFDRGNALAGNVAGVGLWSNGCASAVFNGDIIELDVRAASNHGCGQSDGGEDGKKDTSHELPLLKMLERKDHYD